MVMIASLVLTLAVATMQLQSPSAASARSLESLGWMSGHWRTPRAPMPRSGPHWAEAVWTSADEYLMVGATRVQTGFGRHSFSYMRIEEEDGIVTLHAAPTEGAALPHRMVSSAPGEAVFENAHHDSRITYRRDGDALIATISRIDGSAARRTRFVRRPAPPPAAR